MNTKSVLAHALDQNPRLPGETIAEHSDRLAEQKVISWIDALPPRRRAEEIAGYLFDCGR